MAIPDFQSIMLPLLNYLRDGRERSNQETLEALAAQFHLSDEERRVMLPSGQQPVFTNRVAWAKSHLKAAGLLESPRRGFYKLSARGQELLQSKPATINLRVLQQFPEYEEFRRSKKVEVDPAIQTDRAIDTEGDKLTPQEHLEYGYRRIREGLAVEILERIKQCHPAFFENLVVELLLAMGYGGSREDAGQTVGKSGDGGIDGVIKEDRLGLDAIYVQAKRWDGPVGRPEVQKFAGALQGQRARKGIFIATSEFTKDAEDYANRIESRIVLIGGKRLAELMIDHGIGVTQVASYKISRIDSDYFESM